MIASIVRSASSRRPTANRHKRAIEIDRLPLGRRRFGREPAQCFERLVILRRRIELAGGRDPILRARRRCREQNANERDEGYRSDAH